MWKKRKLVIWQNRKRSNFQMGKFNERMKKTLKSRWSLKKPLYLDKTDKRYKAQMKQLKDKGFSDSETWSLHLCVAEFILPRLKRFKKINAAYPAGLTSKKWTKILNKMIFAFEWTLQEDGMTGDYTKLTDKEMDARWKRYKKGMNLFAEYFMALWW